MASRKEQKEQLRRERLEREQAAAAAAARRRRMGYVVAGGLVAAVVVAVVVIALGSGGGGSNASASDWPSGSIPSQKVKDLGAAVKAAGCTYQTRKIEGRDHVTTKVKYKSQPPTSGNHNPVPAHDRAYLQSPGTEHLVHSLEHGRVIYWFRPNAPAAVKGDLKKLYDEDSQLVIVAPDTRPMPYEVAVSAWGKFVGCPKYNDKVPDAFRAFRDQFRLKGPEYFPNTF
jgi:hypothetical protein